MALVESKATLGLIGIRQSCDLERVEVVTTPIMYRAIIEQLSGDLGGEAVVLSLKSGKYYGLNTLGSRIWELLQTPQSLAAVEAIILSEFEVDAGECHTEVSSFIRLLESEGLIESLNGFHSEISPAAQD